MKKLRDAAYLLALALFFAVAVLFSLPGVHLLHDGKANELLCGALARFALVAALIVLLFFRGQRELLRFPWNKGTALFCLLPLLVAAVNFPFSALAMHTAKIDRPDLIPLFVLLCFSVGASEELLFRAVLHTAIRDALKKSKHGMLFSVLLSSAVFALWHLVNLFFGAGVGETLLQVGYTFLLGAMFAAVLERTNNLWLCALLHALFDVGGTLIAYIGSGNPHDVIFWILTAAAGVLCAVQIVIFVLRADKRTERSNHE